MSSTDHRDEDIIMATKAEPLHPRHLLAFLTASREYLGLARNSAASAPPCRTSELAAKPLGPNAAPYRKAIQSLLLAVGVGSFAAGPALADEGCGPMGKPAPEATMSDKAASKS